MQAGMNCTCGAVIGWPRSVSKQARACKESGLVSLSVPLPRRHSVQRERLFPDSLIINSLFDDT